ncbi:MAG: EamA family transporter [Deltaproteobacteria bacterium]|nr:MAG: EamA family transporter [Deltaproteobacteria bacterium]
MGKNEIQGCLYILVGTTLWGFSTTVAKALFNAGISPFELVPIRLPIASAILFVTLFFYDRKRILISPKDFLYFVLFGIFGVVGNQLCFYVTVSKIQVGPAVLIQYISVLWITLFALFFQKEPLFKGTIAALLLALLGCYLVVGGYRTDLLRLNKAGILIGFCSSFFVAFYALYGEKGLKRYDAWTLLLYGFLFGGLFCWIAFPPVQVLTAGYPLKIWAAFFYIAIFATLIPFGLFFKGIERIRATRASITGTWEPVISCVTAYVFLGEVLDPLQILGGLVVIAAVILLQLSKEKKEIRSPLEIRQDQPVSTKSHTPNLN